MTREILFDFLADIEKFWINYDFISPITIFIPGSGWCSLWIGFNVILNGWALHGTNPGCYGLVKIINHGKLLMNNETKGDWNLPKSFQVSRHLSLVFYWLQMWSIAVNYSNSKWSHWLAIIFTRNVINKAGKRTLIQQPDKPNEWNSTQPHPQL